MTTLDKDFEQAQGHAKNLNNDLDTEDLLRLYGLYKQANFGKNTNPKPSIFNFKGLQKWKAWTSVADLTKDEAKTQYIKVVAKLLEEYT